MGDLIDFGTALPCVADFGKGGGGGGGGDWHCSGRWSMIVRKARRAGSLVGASPELEDWQD